MSTNKSARFVHPSTDTSEIIFGTFGDDSVKNAAKLLWTDNSVKVCHAGDVMLGYR